MEIEYPDSGNDSHFINYASEATPGVLISSRHHTWLKLVSFNTTI